MAQPIIRTKKRKSIIATAVFTALLIVFIFVYFIIVGLNMTNDMTSTEDGKAFALLTLGMPIVAIFLVCLVMALIDVVPLVVSFIIDLVNANVSDERPVKYFTLLVLATAFNILSILLAKSINFGTADGGGVNQQFLIILIANCVLIGIRLLSVIGYFIRKASGNPILSYATLKKMQTENQEKQKQNENCSIHKNQLNDDPFGSVATKIDDDPFASSSGEQDIDPFKKNSHDKYDDIFKDRY